MRRKIRLALFLLILCIPAIHTQAQSVESRTVRVGYFLYETFQEVDEYGQYSGYAYDYYRELGQIAGFDYEFVNGTFEECFSMLLRGEIDVIAGVNITQDRKEYMDFSQFPAFEAQPKLYARVGDAKLSYEDYESFQGIKIATIKGDATLSLLDSYCQEHNLKIDKKFYTNQQDMQKALENGEVDAAFSGSLDDLAHNKVIARLEKTSLYFATRKGDPLIEEINQAMWNLENIYPYFEYDLYEKYSNREGNIRPDFTKEELAYIQSAPSIRVVYDANWEPIEYRDEKTGEYRGITADLFRLIEEYTGMQFEYSTSDTFSETLNTLKASQVDVLSAISRDYNWADENNVYLSAPYLDTSVVMISRPNGENVENGIIALPVDYYTSGQIARKNQDRAIAYYSTIEECLRAVRDGRADITYVNNYVADYCLSLPGYASLNAVKLTEDKETLAIAVSKDANPLLLSILNKAVMCISQEQIDGIVLKNSIINGNISVGDFLRANAEQVIMVLVAVFLLVVSILVYIIRLKTINNNIVQKIARKDALTGLLNRAAIEEEIEAELKIRQPGNMQAMLSMDMDNFKEVNDEYGHPEGDELLKEIAKMLTDCMEENDIVGRMGGDEFLIYLKKISSTEEISEKAEKIKRATHQLGKTKEEWKNISFSIGCAVIPRDGDDFNVLYKAADIALYQAKGRGRDMCVIYEPIRQNQI